MGTKRNRVVCVAIFMIIRQMNKMKKEEEAPPAVPTTKDCPLCLSAIPIKATRCAHCTAEVASA